LGLSNEISTYWSEKYSSHEDIRTVVSVLLKPCFESKKTKLKCIYRNGNLKRIYILTRKSNSRLV